MKKRTAHKQNRFLNCLRVQIVPNHYEEQRINGIVNFCKKYAFDNVMLFINAEEYNTGHMTIEEAKPWIETIKRAKEALTRAGISVSLNPWIEIGHLDRGRKLKDGQNFVTQCDYDGKQCTMVACPMDEKWLEYFIDFYAYLLRETEPEVVWIEDDFRLHNHGGLQYGGCFCEHHMKAFNQRLGTNYSREEFTDLLFRKNPDETVKKVFLEVNRECMVVLAEKIGSMVQKMGLGTKVGLMSSNPQMHCMEYRDWNRIYEGLSQCGLKINRPHLPLYLEDVSLKKYYQEFNSCAFVCRGFLPEDCHVLPELENASFMTYAKDAETLRFQVEAAIPLEIEGMTYDIFDFAGNGAVESFEYGEAVSEITDYLTSVMESGYSYYKLSGVTILLDEQSSYNRPVKNSFFDMCPDEYYLGNLLQGNGISVRCSKEKKFRDEVVTLTGGNVYNLSDAELKRLFEDNYVIVEGNAVTLLVDRGLGSLIHACSYQRYITDFDIHSYEQIEGDTLVNGIPGYRASAFNRTGDYVSISYIDEPQVKSRVYDYEGNELGYGFVVAGKHLVVPYVIDKFLMDQLHPLRGKIYCDYIDSLRKDFVRADYSNIYAYYSKAEQNILILVNPTMHTLPVTRFKMTGNCPQKISEIHRDGSIGERQFSIDEEGFIAIEESFDMLTTKTFILEV